MFTVKFDVVMLETVSVFVGGRGTAIADCGLWIANMKARTEAVKTRNVKSNIANRLIITCQSTADSSVRCFDIHGLGLIQTSNSPL